MPKKREQIAVEFHEEGVLAPEEQYASILMLLQMWKNVTLTKQAVTPNTLTSNRPIDTLPTAIRHNKRRN